MDRDNVVMFGILASVCATPIIYALVSDHAAHSAQIASKKSSSNEIARIQNQLNNSINSRQKIATTSLKLMLQYGVCSKLLSYRDLEITQLKDANERLTLDNKRLSSDALAAASSSSNSSSEINLLQASSKIEHEELLSSLSSEATRHKLLLGLNIRQSRLKDEETRRLKSRLTSLSKEKDELEEKSREHVERLNNKLLLMKEQLSQKEALIAHIQDQKNELEIQYQNQRVVAKEFFEDKERFKEIISKLDVENRKLHGDYLNLETTILKGGPNPKFNFKRISSTFGSLKIGSKKSSWKAKDSEDDAKKQSPYKYRSVTA